MKMSRLACLVALLLMPLMGIAQEIDLWDTWRLGFEKYEAAEKEFKKKNFDAALKLYKESQTIFQKIKSTSPDWNTDVVAYRISLCDRKIKSIKVPAAPTVDKRLTDEVVKLRKEVQDLKAQLRQTRVQLIDARNAADRMALTEKQIRKLMTENSDLQKKLAAKDATITSLRADLRRSDKTAEFQKLLLDAKTDIERLRLLNDRLKKDLDIAKKRAQKFMEQRNSAEAKVFRMENLMKELTAKTKEVEILSGENRKLAAALSQITEKLKLAEQATAAARQENAGLLGKIGDMESGKILSPSEKKLREDLAAERQTVVSLKAVIEKLRRESQSLSADLAKLRGENQKVVLDLVKITELLAKLRNENGAQAKIIAAQKAEIDAAAKLAAENAALKKSIEEISRNFENFRQQAQKDTADKIKELNVALENARAEYRFMAERLRRADENLKDSIAKLQQTIVKLEEEKAVLRQSLVLANQNVGASKTALEKLRLEYLALKKEFDALNVPAPVVQKNTAPVVAVNKELEAKLEKLTKELAQLRKENEEYRARLAVKPAAPAVIVDKELEAKLEKLTKELAQLRKENAEYRARLAAKPVEKTAEKGVDPVHPAVAINKELEAKLEKLTKELAQLRKENAEYRARLAAKPVEKTVVKPAETDIAAKKELEAKLEKLTKELAQLRKENADYRAQLAAKDAAAAAAKKDLESQLEKLSQNLAQLRKENAKYRVQLAAFAQLQKELDDLRGKLTLANNELAKKDSENVAFKEQIRLLTQKVNEQILAVKAAQDALAQKDVVINNNAKDMQKVIDLLKKQLLAAQTAEATLRKELELLKMEYSDLEKKSADSVPKSSLTALREQIARLDKELTTLRAAKAESDAALKAAENLVKLQNKRLADFATQINPDAKNQISKLTAAVIELQEAKLQYEALISKLRSQIKELNEDNKELKLANTGLRADVAEMRVKPVELQKIIADLKAVNENLRKLNAEQTEQVRLLREKTAADDKVIASLRQELTTIQNLVQRYRKELNDWGELPQANMTEELAKKDKAIDILVAENASLRKERDMLRTELTLSKDFVVKYKKLALDLDMNLQMNRFVLARLKNALARYTSAADVENLVADVYDSKKGEIGTVAPVENIQSSVAAIKKDDAPKFTPEQIAERDAAYKVAMSKGLKAENDKNYSEALMQYWRASDLCTDGAEVHKALARVYLAKRDFQNARNHYRIAVQKFNLKRDPAFEEKLVILAQEVADLTVSEDAGSENNKKK